MDLEGSAGPCEIYRYIANQSPGAARSVRDRIKKRVKILREQPNSGRPGRVEGTRELVLAPLPYIIPYRVKSNRVELLRVLHTSRLWPDQFSE